MRNNKSSPLFWRNNTIISVLKQYFVASKFHTVNTLSKLDKVLLSGNNIGIININMWNVPRGIYKNKPYFTLHPFWGHYLIIRAVEGLPESYIVYDPYTPHIQERFYDKQVIFKAILTHNNGVHIVSHTDIWGFI